MSQSAAICPDCGMPMDGGEGLCRRCLVEQVLFVDPALDEEFEHSLGDIGDYEILEKIAQGGMGIVYRARQKSLDRIVAVKLIPEGRLASVAEVQRFRMEAEAAAELNHPNIVSVHEIGEEDGQHFFSMRLVEGGSLRERLDEFRNDPRKVAELMVKIARAVHFAHQRGILHRDLKPGNILIDADGEPQIMDFGLAKRLDGDPHLTIPGQVLGSPAYMAPELLTGEGTASMVSEVYSLGVMLYQLLAGRVPFEGTSQLAIIRHVTEEEPERLPTIDRDLETICLKSMAKEPSRRYGSAEELALDLENWIGGRPIQARPVTRIERLQKWVRRKPAVAALIAVSLLAASVSWVVLWRSNIRIKEERNRALASESDTRMQLYVSDMAAVQRAIDAGSLFQARNILSRHVPKEGMEDLRGFEWRHFWLKCQGDEAFTLPVKPDREIMSIDFSPDGKVFAVGGNGFAYLYDYESRELLKRIPEDQEYNLLYTLRREVATLQDELFEEEREGGRRMGSVRSISFLDDEGRILLGGSEDNGMIWNWKKPRILDWFPIDRARIVAVPKSGFVAVGTGWMEFGDGVEKVELHNSETLEVVGPEFTGSGGLVDVSADGQWILTGDNDGNLKLFSRDGVERASAKMKTPVTSLALSPDGMMVAASLQPKADVFLWDIKGKSVRALKGHRARVYSVDFSPDGQTLASTGSDQTICLWDVKTRKRTKRLLGHTAEVLVVKFSPDGRWLFSGGRDFGIHIWDMQDNALKDTYPDLFSPFTFSPDSDKIAIASITGDVDVLNLESGDTIMLPLEDTARTLRFDSDGKTLNAVAQVDAPGGAISFHSWNAASGEPLQSGRPVKVDSGLDFPHCAIFADHQRVAISHFQKRKKFGIFDFETGEEVDVVEVENRSNTVTALSLESGSGDIWFTLWADRIMRKRGSKVEEVIITPNEAKSLALCEKYVAIGLADGRIYIYDRETCGVLMVLSGHLDDVNQLAFSYDGSRLVSASEDRTLRLWSLPARREITVLHAENNWSRLEFSPDGKIFAASGWGGGIQLWRAPDLNEIDAKKSLFR